MTGFKSGLAIGVLAAAVVALGIALFVTLSGDSNEPSRIVVRETPSPKEPEPDGTNSETPTVPSGVVNFAAPSRNILCRVDADEALCAIGAFSYTPPPQPPSCQLAGWGQFVSVKWRGRARFVCADGIPAPIDSPVLEYGKVLRTPGFECGSSEEGVYCEHKVTGHGFALSREQFALR